MGLSAALASVKSRMSNVASRMSPRISSSCSLSSETFASWATRSGLWASCWKNHPALASGGRPLVTQRSVAADEAGTAGDGRRAMVESGPKACVE